MNWEIASIAKPNRCEKHCQIKFNSRAIKPINSFNEKSIVVTGYACRFYDKGAD